MCLCVPVCVCVRATTGANYYRVEREMKDADLRLTDDVQRLAHGCTSFFTQGVRTGTTLVSFGGLVVWQFGANQKTIFSLSFSLSFLSLSLSFSLSFLSSFQKGLTIVNDHLP